MAASATASPTVKRAEATLEAACVSLADQRPYYSSLLYTLRRVWVSPQLMPTLAVDSGMRLFINPEFVLKLGDADLQQLVGVLAHELNHIIRDHAGRREDRDRNIWNLAADIEINQDLLADGLTLPDGHASPIVFELPPRGIAEACYRRLERKMTTDDCDTPCGQNALAVHKAALYELAEEAGVEPCSEAEHGLAIEATSKAAEQYEGPVPGRMRRRSAIPDRRSELGWRQILSRAIVKAGKQGPGVGHYTYQRPSRRHPTAAGQPVFPRSVSLAPRIAVVLDTSGSMRRTELGAALAEIDGVLRAENCQDITVYAGDCRDFQPQRVTSARQIKLTGGGGTDMGKGIQAALSGTEPADLVIVLTDGGTPWPKHKPKAPVIIALTDHRYLERCHPPPWATTLVINSNHDPDRPKQARTRARVRS